MSHESELMLALDLRKRTGVQPDQENLARTKSVLDEWALSQGHRPRPMAGLIFKLGNFHAIATGRLEGLSHGGAGDQRVWDSLADDAQALREAVAKIKKQLEGVPPWYQVERRPLCLPVGAGFALMARPGLEPGTPRFSVVCSTS